VFVLYACPRSSDLRFFSTMAPDHLAVRFETRVVGTLLQAMSPGAHTLYHDQNYSQVKVRFIPNGVYDFPIGDIGGVCCDSDDVLSGSRGALIYLTALNAPRIPALPWALCCLSKQRSGGRNTSCFDRVQFSGYTKRLRYDVSS
jgi:hypothetical protein